MKAAFDSHSDSYVDEVNRAIAFSGKDVEFFARRKAALLAELVRERGWAPSEQAILDVGCGVGLVDRYLVDTFGDVSGIDLSENELNRARATVPRASYLRSAPETIPHPDTRFDVAFAANVLHHTPQPGRAPLIAEIVRVVRPGGLIVVFEHNPLNPLTRRVVSRISFDEGVVLLRPREVVALFRGSGVESMFVRNMTFLPFAGATADFVERRLAWLPLGAQYAAVGVRPPG